jgi:hypothetical protein
MWYVTSEMGGRVAERMGEKDGEGARGDRDTLIRSDAWRQQEKLPGENEKENPNGNPN